MKKHKIIAGILIVLAVLLFFITPLFPFDEMIIGAVGAGLGIKELLR